MRCILAQVHTLASNTLEQWPPAWSPPQSSFCHGGFAGQGARARRLGSAHGGTPLPQLPQQEKGNDTEMSLVMVAGDD